MLFFSSMLRVGIDTHLIVVSDPGRDERNKRERKRMKGWIKADRRR